MRARPYRISKLWGTRELSNRFNIKKIAKKPKHWNCHCLWIPVNARIRFLIYIYLHIYCSPGIVLSVHLTEPCHPDLQGLPSPRCSLVCSFPSSQLFFLITRLLPVFQNRINGHFLLYLRPLFTIQCTSCMLGLIEHSCYL